MILITGWLGINTGCKENMQKVIYELLFGLLRGGIFFYFISDRWNSIEKGKLERESCDSDTKIINVQL